MLIYVDIDNTICQTTGMDYEKSKPIFENISKINRLYDQGNEIYYWSARGSVSKIDWHEITLNQLLKWGCKFNGLSVGDKPPYDLLICDKSKRIEEI